MNQTRSAVSDWVVGLDLSLTGAGVCCVPCDWGGDWGRVRTINIGYGAPVTKWEKECFAEQGAELWNFERLMLVTRNIVDTVPQTHSLHSLRVYAESVFMARNPSVTIRLSKLRGSVERAIWFQRHAMTHDVSPSTHHKSLTGRGFTGRGVYGPRLCVKNQRRQVLLQLGAPEYWTENQVDACSVANYGMFREFGRGFLGVTR